MKSTKPILMAALGLWLLAPQLSHAFYSPSTGRWLSRDPLEDAGDGNRYGFVGNAAPNKVDDLGLVIVGFYGLDISYRWPNWGNVLMEEMSEQLAKKDWMLRPMATTFPPPRPNRLYQSRDVRTAFNDLLAFLDTNGDGVYDQCDDGDDDKSIKIFGWSWGATSAVELAAQIQVSSQFKKKHVALVAAIDTVTFARGMNPGVTANVTRFWHRYQTKGKGVNIAGVPVHGHRVIASPGVSEDQRDMNPDGNQTVEIGGQSYSVNHVTVIWEVANDFMAQF